jgi:hypothetical protein
MEGMNRPNYTPEVLIRMTLAGKNVNRFIPVRAKSGTRVRGRQAATHDRERLLRQGIELFELFYRVNRIRIRVAIRTS